MNYLVSMKDKTTWFRNIKLLMYSSHQLKGLTEQVQGFGVICPVILWSSEPKLTSFVSFHFIFGLIQTVVGMFTLFFDEIKQHLSFWIMLYRMI